MPLRGELGLSSGNHAQVPVSLLDGFPVKKPCGSVLRPPFSPPNVAGTRAAEASRARKIDSLYLFYCGLGWHKSGDTGSGWELVQAMRSRDRGVRALASELFAETENGRLLARDLRRTRAGLSWVGTVKYEASPGITPLQGRDMNTPYGLPIIENCTNCPIRGKGWYCDLSKELLRSFSTSSHLATYPGGAILFVEGQLPRGAYILCSGKVKLSTTSREGKVLILKVAEPGEVIGLSAVISGEAYEITAETLEPCLVNFVDRHSLLRLMERSGELGLRSAQAVSHDFQYAYREIHELVLSRSSSGKLARLLLSWIKGAEDKRREVRIHAPVTHEEMAQRIGASRETVTRLLSELKKKDLIQLEGTTLVIKNRTALESMAM